jgi:hypothetical protein
VSFVTFVFFLSVASGQLSVQVMHFNLLLSFASLAPFALNACCVCVARDLFFSVPRREFMSGEVVMSSVVIGSGAGVVAVAAVMALVVAGSAAAVAISALRQAKQKEAAAQAALAQRQLQAWQTYQAVEQQHMQALHASRRAMRQTLQVLQQSSAPKSTTALPATALASGFLNSATSAQASAQLMQIQTLLQQVSTVPRQPLSRLQAQASTLLQRLAQGEYLDPDHLASFQTLVERSLEQLSAQTLQQAKTRQQRLSDLEAILNQILTHEYLVAAGGLLLDGAWQEELHSLKQQVLQLLGQREVNAGSLSVLKHKAQQLQQSLDEAQARQALTTVLDDTLQRHLQSLGYVRLDQPQPGEASWAIPGGERLRSLLHADGRLVFQVQHERAYDTQQALSAEERAFFQQQEARWCSDVPLLLRALVQEGFQYQVQFERSAPQQSVPIAVLENVDEILAAEQAQVAEARQRRYHPLAE